MPFNEAAYVDAEATFIAERIATLKVGSDNKKSFEMTSEERELEQLIYTETEHPAHLPRGLAAELDSWSDPNTGIPYSIYESNYSKAINAASVAFTEWVDSIPAKANFTAAQLAASWRQFMLNFGIPGFVTAPVPAAATAAVNSGGGNLGMYIVPSTPIPGDWGASGGGAVINGKGFRLSDTAGLLAPGTTGPSFRAAEGSGALHANYDASRFFGMPLANR